MKILKFIKIYRIKSKFNKQILNSKNTILSIKKVSKIEKKLIIQFFVKK